jgi:hypothetical protein
VEDYKYLSANVVESSKKISQGNCPVIFKGNFLPRSKIGKLQL